MLRKALLLISLLLFMPASALALDSQAARQELQRLNIPFTDEEFFQRIESGDAEAVELLLDAGTDANINNESGTPALVIASGRGHLEMVRALLAHGADANAAMENGPSALMFAAWSGHRDVVKLLLQAGADVNAETPTGDTALLSRMLMRGDNITVINILLDAGARTSAKTEYGMSALLMAATYGNAQVVEALLQHGVDVNERWAGEDVEIGGKTPLMFVAGEGNLDIVKMLLKYGAKIELQDAHGNTAATIAAAAGHMEVARLLKENLEEEQDSMTELMWAAAEGDMARVQELLAENVRINAKDQSGKSALSYAAHNGKKAIVEALLAGGADVDDRDNYGRTALMVAASNIGIVEILLEHGAIINLQDECGGTALSHSCFSKTSEGAELLLRHGADPDMGIYQGNPPLSIVQEADWADVGVRILLDAGANVNAVNIEGQTPLDVAEELNNAEVIRLLKAAGAKRATELSDNVASDKTSLPAGAKE